jgi:hypothetical protein
MTALSKTALKNLWKAYFQPTSADFSNLIDSWTDYKIGLETLGQEVSAGGVGVPEYSSPVSVTFRATGVTGRNLLATSTQASARTALNLGPLATQTQVSAANIAAASVSALQVVTNSLTLNKLVQTGTSGQSLISGGVTSDAGYGWTGVVQVVNSTLATVATTANAMPYDDTPPLASEGGVFLSASIAPKSAAHLIRIEATINAASSSGSIVMAIFQDAATTCMAAVGRNTINTAGAMYPLSIIHVVTAASTATREYRLRAGCASGTLTINGEAGARLLGGAAISSMTVTELAPQA